MAKSKVAKPKSREARRAASPGLEITAPRIEEPSVPEKLAALGVRGENGVSKKRGKKKQLTRAQKERQEAARDKAEAALEKLETKVDKSKNRGKTVESRRVRQHAKNGGGYLADDFMWNRLDGRR